MILAITVNRAVTVGGEDLVADDVILVEPGAYDRVVLYRPLAAENSAMRRVRDKGAGTTDNSKADLAAVVGQARRKRSATIPRETGPMHLALVR